MDWWFTRMSISPVYRFSPSISPSTPYSFVNWWWNDGLMIHQNVYISSYRFSPSISPSTPYSFVNWWWNDGLMIHQNVYISSYRLWNRHFTMNFTMLNHPELAAVACCFEVDPDGRQFLAEFRDEGLERQDSAPWWTTSSGFSPCFFFQGKSLFFLWETTIFYWKKTHFWWENIGTPHVDNFRKPHFIGKHPFWTSK